MAYLALARAGFRRWSSYRAATVAGVLTNTAFGFLRVAILFAALRAGGAIGGYTPEQAATYTWLTQALIMTIAMWNWVDLATRIQTGDIITDLQRPIDLQGAYLAEDLGRAGYQLLARAAPVPDRRAVLHARVPRVARAMVRVRGEPGARGRRQLRDAVHREPVRVLGARLARIAHAVERVHDGRVGLRDTDRVLPHVGAKLFILLPWASMIQIPIDVFMGRRTGAGLGSGLALQLGWAIVLLAAGRLLLANASRRVVVQGG